jgi:AcrR family transcriptional regulator
MSGTDRRSRPGGRTAAVLARIYDTTLSILRDRGLGAVTFNEVAIAADVNRSTLYRRWPDRNELVLDAMMASVTQLIVPLRADSLLAEIRSVLEQIGDYLSTPLGYAVLVAGLELGTSDSPTGQRHIAMWRERLRDFYPIFERAQARGELDADFDWDAAFAMAAGAVYYRIILHHEPVDRIWVDRIMAQWSILLRS